MRFDGNATELCLWLMPARLKDIRRALEDFGVTVREPKGGSHWMATKDGCRSTPLATHNGERGEIADVYIKQLCRNFGIDLAEFKKLL